MLMNTLKTILILSVLSLYSYVNSATVTTEKVCWVVKSPFGNGQSNPTTSFQWGPKTIFDVNGKVNVGMLDVDAGTETALKLNGRVDLNGDVNVNKPVHVKGKEFSTGQRLKIKILTVNEIKMGRYLIRDENGILVIRDTKIAGKDYRYSFRNEVAIELIK